MFDFLRSIGLRPLEWSPSVNLTGKGSPYTGEVLESAFAEAQAVVVVLTGDDIAFLRSEFCTKQDPAYETEPTPQARPNVIFEAGMAFGTHPERTLVVEIGEVRPFSDVLGRNAIRLANSTQSRQALAQRLKKAGCAVDLTGTDWHTAGCFKLNSESVEAEATATLSNASASSPSTSTNRPSSDKLEKWENYAQNTLLLMLSKKALDRYDAEYYLSNKLKIPASMKNKYAKDTFKKCLCGGFLRKEKNHQNQLYEYTISEKGVNYLI